MITSARMLRTSVRRVHSVHRNLSRALTHNSIVEYKEILILLLLPLLHTHLHLHLIYVGGERGFGGAV